MQFETTFKQQLTAYKGKKVLLTLTTENFTNRVVTVVDVQDDFASFESAGEIYPDIIPFDKIACVRFAKVNDD